MGRTVFWMRKGYESRGKSSLYSGFKPCVRDEKYCGNSTVSGPDGTVLLRLQTTGEAYGEVILEKGKLEEAREGIPWRKMKQPEIYRQIAENTKS